MRTLQGHSNGVFSAIFALNGKTLISGSSDSTIRLWDISAGECTQVLQGHQSGIFSIALSPQGNIIASASDDLTVKLEDIYAYFMLNILQ
ncbi:MAG: WD40 repeat domain-containing protein [Heteroscytonema crispum UTEX LB 1556]